MTAKELLRLTDGQFKIEEERAKRLKQSPFARFAFQLSGWVVKLRDVELSAWELFHSGYSVLEIKHNKTRFKAYESVG